MASRPSEQNITGGFPDVVPDLAGPDPVQGIVFVFGSNTAGRHGKGAALTARRYYGAKTGAGEGITGSSYALPTKDYNIRTLPLRDVKASIVRFVKYASDCASETNPTWFLVTRVGCGLAGFTDEEIAPLFAAAPRNCILPHVWEPILKLYAAPEWFADRVWHTREAPK